MLQVHCIKSPPGAEKGGKDFLKSAGKILSDSDFAETVLAAANKEKEREYDLQSRGFTVFSQFWIKNNFYWHFPLNFTAHKPYGLLRLF